MNFYKDLLIKTLLSVPMLTACDVKKPNPDYVPEIADSVAGAVLTVTNGEDSEHFAGEMTAGEQAGEMTAGEQAGEMTAGEMFAGDDNNEETDSDSDGVTDDDDLCPETLLRGELVDSRGCVNMEALNDRFDAECPIGQALCSISCSDEIVTNRELYPYESGYAQMDGACMVVKNSEFIQQVSIDSVSENYIPNTSYIMYYKHQTIDQSGINSLNTFIYPIHYLGSDDNTERMSLNAGIHVFQANPRLRNTRGNILNGPFNDSFRSEIGIKTLALNDIETVHSNLNIIGEPQEETLFVKSETSNNLYSKRITIQNFYPESSIITYQGILNLSVSHIQTIPKTFTITTTNANGEFTQDYSVDVGATFPLAFLFDSESTITISYQGSVMRFNLTATGTIIDEANICDETFSSTGLQNSSRCEN